MKNLFENNYENVKPLPLILRPKTLDEIVGQEKILGKNGILRKIIEKGNISNMILYGPPGCGKSTLGEIISKSLEYSYETLNATTASLSDLKEIVERARKNIEFYNRKTILFLDEIHRFNKLQQDGLLSYIENGTLILIGATTENPYHNLNNALLSRVLIFKFEELKKEDIRKIVEKGEKYLNIEIPNKIRETILKISKGDSRTALNYVELYKNTADSVDERDILEIFEERGFSYDKAEDKYNIISALIKSIRGSEPNSALYWLGRLLAGGEDPRYIARRLVISASEDIGLANPEAFLMASYGLTASEKIGMPEIRIILAEITVYLAISTKSNSCYNGINKVLEDIKKGDFEGVPNNIKENPIGYKYPHDYENNFIFQNYGKNNIDYYIPGDNRNEKLIKEKLEKLWKNK
ncbi:putative ATPase [Cetobacterium ceti]|uniref:Putative ATPase n=1 Tax=Cetobacterium ceti TaxID=180163 RepID=A0A1T4KTE3_9FUSO|nr:replication-associated recombination protein A [Cetobacterium ceti]SJZ45699.1 putative ATPase [Cetobacterium ceti]